MTTSTALIADAALNLGDSGFATWTQAELLTYLNQGLYETVRAVPVALTKVGIVTLVAGPKQTIPSDGIALIRVINAVNGTTRQNGVTDFDIDALNAFDPDWMKTTGTYVLQATRDVRNDKQYWVYPPQLSGSETELEIEYSEMPAALTLGATIPIDGVWEPALLNYMYFRAYSKDGNSGAQDALAAGFYNAFKETTSGNDT